MDLKTKYKINDQAWFLHPKLKKGDAVYGRIKQIKIEVLSRKKYVKIPDEICKLMETDEFVQDEIEISYYIDGFWKNERHLYESKEYLIERFPRKAHLL